MILAGATVRKLSRAAKNAEGSGMEYVKVPVSKYVALLREAEGIIRDMYGKVKIAEARIRALEEAPVVLRQIDAREFPKRLRAARRAMGLTQQQLACKVNISYASVCQLERGMRGAKWHRIVELAEALGCSPEWLAASKMVAVAEEAGEKGEDA